MSRDLELLGQYEQKLLDMEEDVIQGKLTNFQNELMPIRRELLWCFEAITTKSWTWEQSWRITRIIFFRKKATEVFRDYNKPGGSA